MDAVIVTGGFDPIHSGHIEYFKAARELGSILFVGLNSDQWLARKKGKVFMPIEERKAVIESIRYVGHVFTFNDMDDTANDAIKYVKNYVPKNSTILFANGGDRTVDNVPEMVEDHKGINFVFGVGGDKKNSSSQILKQWREHDG
jgi:cytidyltransferase-like protein